jgi:hypothetical protein
MTAYEARLSIEGETEAPTRVLLDLTDDRLTMTIVEEEVAAWAREGMRISALPDGFHIRADGEAVVLDVEDDAHFALDLGLRNAHPTLRRKMSALLREQ